MGLFDTKYCSICGNKVGLLGGMKLDDGHLCKDCTAKLSPYFSRRHQTVDTIRKHLAYREANAKALSSLQISGNYGDSQKIWIDSANRRFVIARTSDFARTNPDIFSFDDVAWIAGGATTWLARLIYIVVALAGLWCVTLLFREEEDMRIDSHA